MSSIDKKTEIQKGLLIHADNDLILLEWATSIGKSFGAIELVNQWKPKRLLLLVAEEAHKDNWHKEFLKYADLNKSDFKWLDAVRIECYASLKKYRDTEWDCIILDECHHISELRKEILKTIQVDKVICLSATLDRDNIDTIKAIYPDKKMFRSRITTAKAIEHELLPEPDIFLIPLTLDDTQRLCEVKEVWGRKEKRVPLRCDYPDAKKFRTRSKYPDAELTILCTQKEANDYYEQQVEYLKQKFFMTYQQFNKIKWLHAGSERKRFLGNIKTGMVYDMLASDRLRGHQTVVYCTSIEQIEQLKQTISLSGGIHSKQSTKENANVLEAFEKGKLHTLLCVGKLTEGQNIKGIEAGVIVQLDGKERPFTQKHGRILRNENPQQYIFYWKGTRDEEYLEKIVAGINPDYIEEI